MTYNYRAFTSPFFGYAVWRPHARPKPVIWLASDFSQWSLTKHSGFHYYFIVYLCRSRTKVVIVIMMARTNKAPFPLWQARGQKPKVHIARNIKDGKLMPNFKKNNKVKLFDITILSTYAHIIHKYKWDLLIWWFYINTHWQQDTGIIMADSPN